MNSALFLLLRLHLKSWGRYAGRSLGTVKGALLVLVGVLVFVPIVLQVFLPGGHGLKREIILENGPGFLLLYCLINVIFSSGERGIYFSPAEIQFLFTGPFSRRQLLGYKVVMLFLLGLPAAVILSLVTRIHSPSFLSAFAGVLLMLLFMNLVALTLNLLALTLDSRLYTRFRRILMLVLVVAAGTFLLVQGGSNWRQWQAGELLQRLQESTVWHVITWPLRSFFEVFLARDIGSLLYWTPLALAVNGVMLIVVFLLDANYLESAAAASARVYARLQRLRSGNILAGETRGGKVRFTLPMLPFWGGTGPILWRQLLTAMRGLGRLTFVFVLFGGMLIAPLAVTAGDKANTQSVLALVAGMTLWLTIMLTAMVPFDFRGDVDRVAVLKSLPILPWRLAVGQLLTPTLMLSCLQWLVLIFIGFVGIFLDGTPGEGNGRETLLVVAACALFVLPFNFLLFGLENLLFLLFPVRLVASTPGDFQAVGRNVLFMMAKMLGIGLVVFIAFLMGFVVYLVTRNMILALAASWMVLVCSAVSLIPAVALAFRSFDVGRDTPP